MSIYGSSQLATITPNGQGGEYTEFNHPDRLGTRLVTNQQGGTAYGQVHLPFGTALNAESSLTTNNKRFTSYDRSSATGLDYAINRTYDSEQGRFTTVDPIGMQAASLVSPQTLNMYTYCANDPINFTDPSGSLKKNSVAGLFDHAFCCSTFGLCGFENGRPSRDRTCDPRIKSPLLYRLSYRPKA